MRIGNRTVTSTEAVLGALVLILLAVLLFA